MENKSFKVRMETAIRNGGMLKEILDVMQEDIDIELSSETRSVIERGGSEIDFKRGKIIAMEDFIKRLNVVKKILEG